MLLMEAQCIMAKKSKIFASDVLADVEPSAGMRLDINV